MVAFCLVGKKSRRWFQIFFIFIPGEIIQFDEHIFQTGWFNHQPEVALRQRVLNAKFPKNHEGVWKKDQGYGTGLFPSGPLQTLTVVRVHLKSGKVWLRFVSGHAYKV